MPSPNFFRTLGLFVRDDFLDPATCSTIQNEMCMAEQEKALVSRKNSQEGVLDEESRKVLSVNVQRATAEMISDKIWSLKTQLEEHFHVHITNGQGPNFLRYGEGAFYRPHRDKSSEACEDILPRQVSVVVFLNGYSKEPAENYFGGGLLTFYGLLDGPEWEKCAFPLEPEPGLLVAFRSDTLHEVQPVTFGQRFTIVSWLTS